MNDSNDNDNLVNIIHPPKFPEWDPSSPVDTSILKDNQVIDNSGKVIDLTD